MYKLRKPKLLVKFLVLNFVLISSTFNNVDCRRLSLKDSLTAYADKTPSEARPNIGETNKKSENDKRETKTSWPWSSSTSSSLHVQQENKIGGTVRNHLDSGGRVWNSTLKETKSNTDNQLSLWGLTKIFPRTFGTNNEKVTRGGSVPITRKPENRNMAYFTMPNNIPQSLKQNQTENVASNVVGFASDKTANTSRSDGSGKDANQQRRDKKEIATPYGFSGLLWNTATALWSVNKEHFLPTFLHTKTGGKLSLVRSSVFKPVSILSQFMNGVLEINKEKKKSLAHLSTPTGGWGSPVPQVLVVKVQPENSRLLPLARYIFRLTKHTAVTKFKLKRALLDLQLRAAKRLVRIITSKNIAQKIAAIRILTNAIWKGKRAVLQIFTGPTETTTYGPYAGVDNSVNVDLTYSSLNKHNNQQWMNYVPPAQEESPPPPTPPVTFTNYYAPPNNPVQSLPPVPNTRFVPPAASLQQPFHRTDYPLPALALPTSAYQSPSPTPIPLIEQPSYAHLLKEMGINPGNYDSQDQSSSPSAAKTPASSIEITSPRPTVVYYFSSDSKNSHVYNRTNNYLPNTIEAPAVSYSYHSTYPQEPKLTSTRDTIVAITSFEKDDDNKITSLPYSAKASITPPPPTSFRFKILEAMGVGNLKKRN